MPRGRALLRLRTQKARRDPQTDAHDHHAREERDPRRRRERLSEPDRGNGRRKLVGRRRHRPKGRRRYRDDARVLESRRRPRRGDAVYITKIPTIEEPTPPADMESNDKAKAEFFAERLKLLEAASNEIPKSLTSPGTSGLAVNVGGAKTEETFDIGTVEE